MNKRPGLTLCEVIRWLIQTLVKMAQDRDFAEIRIIVQGGQIEIVQVQHSYKGQLPQVGPGGAVDHVVRELAAAS